MRRLRRHGMTLMELTFGLASLSVLGLAIGSLMVGAGTAWETKENYVEQNQSLRAVTARIGEWVRQSERVISVHGDSRYADVVLWANDQNDVGNVNLGELKVITYDQQAGTVTLYQADATASNLMSPQVVGAADFAPTFRRRNDVTAYPMAGDVTGFAATATNGMFEGLSYRYLHLEMVMDSPNGVADQKAMVAAAVRAPEPTIDFIGETEDGDAGDDGGTNGGSSSGGLSIGLGIGVLGIDLGAAVRTDSDNVTSSVFVGSSTVGVNVGGSGDADSGEPDEPANTGSNQNNSNSNNSNTDTSTGDDRGRGNRVNDNRGRGNDDDRGRGNRVNDNRGRGNDDDRGRGNRVNDNRGRGNDDDRGRGNRVNDNRGRGNDNRDRGRDSDDDHDRGRGNDGHDRGRGRH